MYHAAVRIPIVAAPIVDRVSPHFRYDGHVYYAREERRGGWSIVCPVCEVRRVLRASIFAVHVDEERNLTVLQGVRCPTLSCGWSVNFVKGIAHDVT